ncbi:unnamed protein product [Nezara viridula]|uniref:Uncharacterized protein n=1 Tax=Nezara viridula TaxID=85310 RepID=A0A9P0HGG6_NEZVI|nr:unnamed protein product [Nezara viridula]
MELTTLLMALGVVLQWTRFQVAFALTLMPLRPNVSCFYTIEMDEDVTAFLSFGYPLTLGFSFAIGQYVTLQLTLPPQVSFSINCLQPLFPPSFYFLALPTLSLRLPPPAFPSEFAPPEWFTFDKE